MGQHELIIGIFIIMNDVALYKFLNKLVVKKYPWIVDCDVVFKNDKPFHKYSVIYYTDSLDITNVPEEEIKKIEELTQNLFKTLGPEFHQILDYVDFHYDEKRV